MCQKFFFQAIIKRLKEWRKDKSIEKTKFIRPDLIKKITTGKKRTGRKKMTNLLQKFEKEQIEQTNIKKKNSCF